MDIQFYLKSRMQKRVQASLPASPTRQALLNFILQRISKPAVYIPYEVLKQSRQGYANNSFIQYLVRRFGLKITENLIKTYHLGSSNSRWPGATVFGLIDTNGNVRAGQVKLFDETGHTAKYDAEGGKKSCTTWLHSILKYNHEVRQEELPQWLAAYLDQGGN